MNSKISWTKYFVVMCLILIFIAFLLKVSVVLNQKTAEMAGVFMFNPWLFMGGKFAVYFLFGVLLGSEQLIGQFRLNGRWKINTPKIVLLGIPTLIFSLSSFIYYGIEIPKYPVLEQIFFPMVLAKFSPQLFVQILFGYIFSTSFYKARQSERNITY